MNNANFAHKNIDKGKTMQRIPRWRTIIKTSLSKKNAYKTMQTPRQLQVEKLVSQIVA